MLKLFKRLFTDSFAFAIASVGNKLVGLLLFPVFLRYMEQVEYADWGMTNTLTLVMTYLSVLGMDAALAFYYHDVKTEQERKAYLTATLISSSFVCLLFILISLVLREPLAELLYESGSQNRWVIFIATVATLGAIIIQLLLAYARFEQRKWFFTLFSMSYVIGSSLLSVYFVVFQNLGLHGIFYGQLIGQCSIALILLYLYRDKFTSLIPREYFKNLLQYGLPLLPTLMVFWVMNMVSRPMIYHMVSPEKAAIYEAALRFASVVVLLTAPFQLAWRPFSLSLKEREDAPRIYGMVGRAELIVGSILIMCLSFVIEPLVELVAGSNKQEYFEAAHYVWLLSFGTILNVLHLIVGVGLLIQKKTKEISRAFLIGASFYFVGCYLLIPIWEIWAVGVVNIFSYLIIVIIIYRQNQKVYPVDFRFRSMMIYIAIYLGLMAVSSMVQLNDWAYGWIYYIVILTLTIITLFASGLLSFQELAKLKRSLRQPNREES